MLILLYRLSSVLIKEVLVDTYYIDGEFIQENEARLPVKDITVLRGYGVFDFLVTYNKRPFFLKEHVTRLENSAADIGLELSHTNSQICEIVTETIKKNPDHTESNVRIVYTGGISPDGVTPQGNGVLMVMVTPKHELPSWWYTNGASVITVDIERFIPTCKSTNYLNAVYAQQLAAKEQAVEAIYVDRQNRVLEGTTTNFFGVKDNTLVTPPDGILSGITRGVVLELAKDRYPIELRHIDKDELGSFDEIFITASNKEIVPIIKINDIEVSKGKPGKQTLEIMRAFEEFTTAYGQSMEKS
jgi:branched-chain amino acid aminotransferase